MKPEHRGLAPQTLGAFALGCVLGIAIPCTTATAESPNLGGTASSAGVHPRHQPGPTFGQIVTHEQRVKRTLRRKLRRVEDLVEAGDYPGGVELLEELVSSVAHRVTRPERGRMIGAVRSRTSEYALRHRLAELCYEYAQELPDQDEADQWHRKGLDTLEAWLRRTRHPDPQSYYYMARAQLGLADYEAGIDSLETAIRIADERGIAVEEPWRELLESMGDRRS